MFHLKIHLCHYDTYKIIYIEYKKLLFILIFSSLETIISTTVLPFFNKTCPVNKKNCKLKNTNHYVNYVNIYYLPSDPTVLLTEIACAVFTQCRTFKNSKIIDYLYIYI